MTPRTVPILCAKAPRHIVYVPAVRVADECVWIVDRWVDVPPVWRCSFCGARVKVVA